MTDLSNILTPDRLKKISAMVAAMDEIMEDVDGIEQWVEDFSGFGYEEEDSPEVEELHWRIKNLAIFQATDRDFIPRLRKPPTGRPKVPKNYYKKMAANISKELNCYQIKRIGNLDRHDSWLINQIDTIGYLGRHSERDFLIAIAKHRGVYPFPKRYRVTKRLKGEKR